MDLTWAFRCSPDNAPGLLLLYCQNLIQFVLLSYCDILLFDVSLRLDVQNS